MPPWCFSLVFSLKGAIAEESHSPPVSGNSSIDFAKKNTRVYAIAESYAIPLLKDLAAKKFSDSAIHSKSWKPRGFLDLIREIYQTDAAGNAKLRDTIANEAANKGKALTEDNDFMMAAAKIPHFFHDFIRIIARSHDLERDRSAPEHLNGLVRGRKTLQDLTSRLKDINREQQIVQKALLEVVDRNFSHWTHIDCCSACRSKRLRLRGGDLWGVLCLDCEKLN